MSVEELPWRPLTVGELLDASVAVLRRGALRLLLIALLLSAAEQALLYPVRSWLPHPHNYFSGIGDGHDLRWWTMISLGMATEAIVIALLGAAAAHPARDLLLAGNTGAKRANRENPQPRDRRIIGLAILSLVIGAGAFVTFFVGVLGWLAWFLFTGLATPILINDARLGASSTRAARTLSVPGAFGRSFALVARSGLRPGVIRLLAYGLFLTTRLILASLGTDVIGDYIRVPAALDYTIWILVNTLIYASIACVDATAHLEARMRLEGLDMELGRAVRRGTPLSDALVVPR